MNYRDRVENNVPPWMKDVCRWVPLDSDKRSIVDTNGELFGFTFVLSLIGKTYNDKLVKWLGFVVGDGWGCYTFEDPSSGVNFTHFKEPFFFESIEKGRYHVFAEFAEEETALALSARVVHLVTGITTEEESTENDTQIIQGITVHPAKKTEAVDNALLIPTVADFADVKEKPTDYLFFPWFPRGKLVQIQGDTSSSKSTFMYAVGAKVSTGADLLSVPCEDPGNVMFLTIEDDESDIKIAFQDAGGNIDHLLRIKDREEIAKLSLSAAGAEMIDKIIKEHDIKLLVFDPIQQFINGDMNKANETRPQLTRLMNIAEENNICIVFLAHMGKDTSKAAIHRGIGSVDIGAATRSIIQIVTDPTDDFYKIAFSVKNNTAAFHDVQRAIRYQVKDHPGSYDPETKKRYRFHGHAEFSEILPEYNERLYRKAVRKADEAEEAEETLSFEYEDDPLVITARELIAQNPQGLFIGTDDLIQKITQCVGHCPYEQNKSKVNGIYNRVSKLRKMMIDIDGIQADIQTGPQYAKAYNWRGNVWDPQRNGKTRGIYLISVKNGTTGSQQTRI